MYGAYGFKDKEERELKMRIHKFEDKLLRSKNYQESGGTQVDNHEIQNSVTKTGVE